MVFVKFFFQKVDFEKNQQMTKSMKNYPVGKQLKMFFNFQTDCTVNTERMRKLEDRFEYELVLRNERAREKLPPYEPPPIPKKEVHFHGGMYQYLIQ